MTRLNQILSEAQTRLYTEPGADIIDWLAKELGTSFDEATALGDLSTFQSHCKAHPLSELLLLDPYSRRAIDKPRGYAGDAVMLDYIYRPDTSSLEGMASIIHRATTTLPNAKSVLWRRDYLANLIFSRMTTVDTARVLTIASGHMRELDVLRELTTKTNVEFTALDQDSDSIFEAKSTYNEFNIIGKCRSFASLIRNKNSKKKFDLIYSAGLLDYLPQATAVSLVKAMFARLLPGGVLSVGNFARDSHGRGFMAGFMDWCLIYRNEEDMIALAQVACPGVPFRIFRDQPRNVVYLEIFAEKMD